jgi:integrase
MRYDEIRSHVERVLRREFEHRFAEIGEKGPRDTYTPDRFDAARAILAEGADAYWKRMGEEGNREWLGKVAQSAGISPNELEPDRVQTLKLLHAGIRAVVDSLESRTEALHAFELLAPPETAKAAPEAAPVLRGQVANEEPGETLAEVADLYIREQVRVGAWVGGTQAKREAMLAVLTELLGATTPMSAISKKDAQDVKSVLFGIPTNKNKHPIARDLSLREAAKLTGLPTLSARTLNDYLGTFHTFTAWAAKNGYAKDGLFEGMNVNAGRAASVPEQVRTAFSPEAISAMVGELTRVDSKVVRKASNKWASLVGIFSGARLSEICSLLVADVQLHDGIWCFSINDIDPDGRKSLKTAAARRLIPVHSSLIKVGFLDYLRERASHSGNVRLFADFTYSSKHGFTKNQGRWFNTTFLQALGLKDKHAVFHALRHTMVTRLHQAGVQLPLVQTLVGHEREGVTLNTYFNESYKVDQLQDAIEKFSVAWKS